MTTELMRFACPCCGSQISSSKSSRGGFTAITFTVIVEPDDESRQVSFPEARAERWAEAKGD